MIETPIFLMLEQPELVATFCWIQLGLIQIHFQYATTNITKCEPLNDERGWR